jgi:transcriptional regulator
MPDDTRADLLQGTLDLLILKSLALGAMHGWGIAQRLRQLSSDALQVQQGSLYPAVHRLERQGLVRSSWGQSENNRRARFYELTRAGQRRLADESETWERFAAAVAQVLGAGR